MTRGERPLGHRGGAGNTSRGVRKSTDEQWDPVDPLQDRCQFPGDEEEDLSYPANDDYIWPTPDNEEDD